MNNTPATTAAALALLLGAGLPTHAGLLITGHFNGHTYQVWGNDGKTNDERDYLSATAFANGLSFAGEPGRLVRIDDAAENAFVHGLLVAVNASLTTTVADGGGARYAWIGADDLSAEGEWRWREEGEQFWSGNNTGSPVGGLYNNWAIGSPPIGSGQSEPDDFGGNQDAAAMALDTYPVGFPPLFGFLGQPGQWNDINHANVLPFVVEFAAIPEPAAVGGLAAGALLGLAAWRGRRRSTTVALPPGAPGGNSAA